MSLYYSILNRVKFRDAKASISPSALFFAIAVAPLFADANSKPDQFNTGNTSAPHLHFRLMEGPSVLGSNGIPYSIDSFAIEGRIPAAEFAAAPGIEGDWVKRVLPAPSPRRDQYPMDLDIVDFSPVN
jgi:hypothetical protein